jgi:hypothetical protein
MFNERKVSTNSVFVYFSCWLVKLSCKQGITD